MFNSISSIRAIFSFLLLISIISLIYSFAFLEYYLGLLPCVLCILERMVVGGILFLSLIGLLLSYDKNIKYLFAIFIGHLLVLLAGLYVAYRHFLLQYFPAEESSCFVALGVEEKSFWTEVVESLASTSDCSSIDFVIFDLSISAQVLVLFTFLLIVVLFGLQVLYKLSKNNLNK